MKNKKERLTYLDVAKGIGILLIVIGHVYAYNKQIVDRFFVIWLYSFHMPLFFIISGMLIAHKNEDNILKFVAKRIKGILIPYAFFSIFSILVFAFVDDFNRSLILRNIKRTIFGLGIDVLWFLPTLFFSEIIFITIKKIIKNKYLVIICSAAIYAVGNILTKYNGILVLFIGRICIATGFIMMGNYSLNFIRKKNMPIGCIIFISIIQIILSKLNGMVDLNNLVLNNRFLYLINSLIGTYIILETSKLIKQEELVYWGKNTLIVMATHLNIISLINKLFGIEYYGYISGLILFVILLGGEKIIIYLINKYIPWIIGKRTKEIHTLKSRRGIRNEKTNIHKFNSSNISICS